MPKSSLIGRKLRIWLPLAILLLCALALRFVFFTGLARGGDSLNYAHAAYALSQGAFDYNAWVGMSRMGLYSPVAFLYWLFGPNDATTLAFPLFASLLSVVFVYSIAKLVAGESAGLVAALLWAFLPLDVYLATSLLPDGALAAFSTGSVYFFLLAERTEERRRKLLLYMMSTFLLGWAILIKPLAIITLFFFLVAALAKAWPYLRGRIPRLMLGGRRQRILFIGLLSFIALVCFIVLLVQTRPFLITLVRANNDLGNLFFTGATELDFGDLDFRRTDLFIFIAPLLLVSGAMLFGEKRKTSRPILVWAAVLFLYYEWGSINPNPLIYNPVEPFKEARNLLFLLAPFVVLTGIYVGSNMEQGVARLLLPGVAAIACIVALITKPELDMGDWQAWTAIASFVLVLGAVISPFIFTRDKSHKLKQAFASLLLLAFCFGMLQPFLPYHALMFQNKQASLDSLQQTEAFWGENQSLPIYASDPMRLNYELRFKLGYAWSGVQIAGAQNRIKDGPIPDKVSGYVVRNTASDFPINWWLQYMSPDNSIQIFRVLNSQDAHRELIAAVNSLSAESSRENLERLYGASINASSWEHYFPAYVRLHILDPEQFPLSELLEKITYYIETHPEVLEGNEFQNADFSNGLENWTITNVKEIELQPSAAIRIRTSEVNSGLSQDVILQPKQIYLFGVRLSTSLGMAVDILRVDNGTIPDSIMQNEAIGGPTDFLAVFVTPDWEGPQSVPIELFVPSGAGRIWLQNPMLISLDWGTTTE
ncbi:MAG: glycosyltransferase family 39 protein [Anaerolineales bacterium]